MMSHSLNLLFLSSVSVFLDFAGICPDQHLEDGVQISSLISWKKSKKMSGGQTSSDKYDFLPSMKCKHQLLDFNRNSFDDQYIGCSDQYETDLMPKILTREKSFNLAFGLAWDRAAVQWNKMKRTVHLPGEFRDEFGIAIIVYTTDWPESSPIYKELNGNVTMAGKSRGHYMENFHYKALHFYLTRALQVLRKNSKRQTRTYKVYRGTDKSLQVSEEVDLRFGRFTSSSRNIEVAKEYSEGLFFEMTTCFGVDIHRISFFPKEQEVLIPVAEKFRFVEKQGNTYVLDSTCEVCSHFNCTYLGDEKQDFPVCSSVP
ncbi:ecto-ADP-ribosyltransferase 5-like isoform X1 [Bufo gargarizans]|uniref:ecto-ADP-ribosyltransferase 5-like isoform X1 n=1 Tax=Bufo gargarizans TaxID=30331 RepID=UPI001CF2DEFE|nr:ecto-ADP-ribosyltransferase 5-like isoform X1 [Bufo gargarizans]